MEFNESQVVAHLPAGRLMDGIPPVRPLSVRELQAVFERALGGQPLLATHRQAALPMPIPELQAAHPQAPAPLDMHQLLGLSDQDFVAGAYAFILKRDVDETGLRNFTEALAAGRSRILVLGDLRYSIEGRAKATPVPGLRQRVAMQKLYRLPLAGRLLRVVTGIAALPGVIRDLARLSRDLGQLRTDTDRGQRRQHEDLQQLGHHVRTLRMQADDLATAIERDITRRIERAQRDTTDRLNKVQLYAERAEDAQLVTAAKLDAFVELEAWAEPIASLAERLDSHLEMFIRSSFVSAQSRRLEALEAALQSAPWAAEVEALGEASAEQRNLAIRALNAADVNRTALRDQERRLSLILTAMRDPAAAGTAGQDASAGLAAGLQDHSLDSLYVAFEDRFRGSRADIKQRQRVYLDALRQAGAGTELRPIVDVGSGRGELLELLNEEGLSARGVDLNHSMVAICSEAGLACRQGDAVAYLSGLGAGSLGAVTGFHIIEHLPFEAMVALFDASLHALATGGIVIFETPNPANLMVASRWFYLDPTHRNPLPGEMVAMIAEARGFVDVSIRELHPMDRRFEARDSVLAAELDSIFHGPQDYAVIARKA